MDQRGGCHTSRTCQWQALEKTFTKLRVLDLDIKLIVQKHLTCLSRSFSRLACGRVPALNTLCDGPIKRGENRELDLHRAIVALSEKMKAVDAMPVRKKMNRHCIPPGR